ncbi:MAG: cell division protein FtsH [Deltaproteobacteria bacterium GWC2_65_14]|nr:MAG: cell division protein FtsH [Deltaproteobacteria bacterium GWC2_65_14]
MNQFYKNLALWMLIVLAMVFFFNTYRSQKVDHEEISFSEFVSAVDSGTVREVTIKGQEITGKYADNAGKEKKVFHTYAPDDPDLVKTLRAKDVKITAKPLDDNPWYMTLLVSWLPMLLLIGVWIFFMRQMQAGGGKAMSFGKSRAKLITETTGHKVTFSDVAGIEEAKEELQEIIAFLRDPKKFTRLGGRIPKGVLLVGAPGTGKTLLARAIAGEAGVPFFSISGSDFVEMFVGVGAARVRDLFIQGKKSAPCIIFIDEIDAVGRHRGAGLGGGHDEREQTLNQLLVELDGFEANEGLILVAATNRPDVLDPALLRPGRFDRQVVVPKPDAKGREQILAVHTKKIPLDEDVKLEILAKGTPGFTGADLANLCNEAALHAASVGFSKVTMDCFEMAKDKVMMGRERRSMIISEEEKTSTAYHEAGHAIVASLTPGADPIHKVSIIPRGMALGVTQQLPIDERHTYSKEYLLATVTILMGGRVSEELVRGELTTGAGNDIERATFIVRKMVCEWGMSEKLGPVTFGQKQELVFLGRDMARQQDYSEETARDIDREVRGIVGACYERARDLLRTNIHVLHRVAKTLLEKEVVDGHEIKKIIEELAVAPGQEPPEAEAGSPA